MNGQNDDCQIDGVSVSALARGRWTLPMRRNFTLTLAIGATLVMVKNVPAMEDVVTGRWITRDPLHVNDASSLPGNPVRPTTPEVWLNPAMLAGVHLNVDEAAMLYVFLNSAPAKFLDASGELAQGNNCTGPEITQLRFYEWNGAWKLRSKADQAKFLANFTSGFWCKKALTTFERISRSTAGELSSANYPYTCRSHATHPTDPPGFDTCSRPGYIAWTDSWAGARVHLCVTFYDWLWLLPVVQESIVAHEASHHFGTNDAIWPLDPWTANTYQAVVGLYPFFFPVFSDCLPGNIEPPFTGLDEISSTPITVPGK